MNATVLPVVKARLLGRWPSLLGFQAEQSVLQAQEPVPTVTSVMLRGHGWHHSASWHVPLHMWLPAVLHNLH